MAGQDTSHGFVKGFHGVRSQVGDVNRAAAFCATHLGFTLTQQQPGGWNRIVLRVADPVELFEPGPGGR